MDLEEDKKKYVVCDSENNWLHTSLEPETIKEAVQGASESDLYDRRAELRVIPFVEIIDVDCAPCLIGEECCKGKNCDPDCCNDQTCNCNPSLEIEPSGSRG